MSKLEQGCQSTRVIEQRVQGLDLRVTRPVPDTASDNPCELFVLTYLIFELRFLNVPFFGKEFVRDNN